MLSEIRRIQWYNVKSMDTKKKNYNFIDLFAGCGGLGEGFMESGFSPVAHVEWETPMVKTLRNNLVKRWGIQESEALRSVIEFDIQKTDELLRGDWSEETKQKYSKNNDEVLSIKGLDGVVNGSAIDVIVGGPPCQAYSIAGRAQDPNSMKDDYRNYLFESFVKVVDHYKPKVFVFENVPGMLSATPGGKPVIERIHTAFDEIGYTIRKPADLKRAVYSSADYQVPQERNRVIIFGVQKDGGIDLEKLYAELDALKSDLPKKTVRDAIANMPKFRPLKNSYKSGGKNISHELVGDIEIPLHIPRFHNDRDRAVFKEWIENSMNYFSTQEKLEYYKKVSGRSSNHNKYRSLEWDKPSPTIVSHLYKDGLMFIHPDIEQLRSITIREAAMLQTFPMDYEFVGSNAYCYKMIGNAVPVLFARRIADAVKKVLGEN